MFKLYYGIHYTFQKLTASENTEKKRKKDFRAQTLAIDQGLGGSETSSKLQFLLLQFALLRKNK